MTLRELVEMAEGRCKDEWSRTATVLAIIANVNRDPKRDAFSPDDFNPYAERQSNAAEPTVGVDFLRDVFVREPRRGDR